MRRPAEPSVGSCVPPLPRLSSPRFALWCSSRRTNPRDGWHGQVRARQEGDAEGENEQGLHVRGVGLVNGRDARCPSERAYRIHVRKMVGSPRRGDRHRARITNQWRATAARSASGPYQISRTTGAQLRPARRAGPTKYREPMARNCGPLMHRRSFASEGRFGVRRTRRVRKHLRERALPNIANQWRVTAARSASGPYQICQCFVLSQRTCVSHTCHENGRVASPRRPP